MYATPSSLAVSIKPSVSCRVSKAEYSAWTASIWAIELALRRVAAEHSDRPMYLVLLAFRISSRAGMDSSRGVLGSIRWR